MSQYIIKAGCPLADEARFAQIGGSLEPSVKLQDLSRARLDSRSELLLAFSRS